LCRPFKLGHASRLAHLFQPCHRPRTLRRRERAGRAPPASCSYFFFFVNAGPHAGFGLQFSMVPAHMLSSCRPVWFRFDSLSQPPGVTPPQTFVSSASLIASREKPPFSIAALNAYIEDAAS